MRSAASAARACERRAAARRPEGPIGCEIGRHRREKRLAGTDVRRCLLPSDVLLTRLERKHKSATPLIVRRLADDSAGVIGGDAFAAGHVADPGTAVLGGEPRFPVPPPRRCPRPNGQAFSVAQENLITCNYDEQGADFLSVALLDLGEVRDISEDTGPAAPRYRRCFDRQGQGLTGSMMRPPSSRGAGDDVKITTFEYTSPQLVGTLDTPRPRGPLDPVR